MTFDEVKKMAEWKGCRLERASESKGCAKSGYVLWLLKRGTWRRFGTLKAVSAYLERF